jgi:cobalt-zinc-cadmium efflux system protein
VSSREAHRHGHGPPGAGHRRPLAIVLGISGTILAVEVVGAFVSGSLALLADAGHMLTDAAGLSLALVAAMLADRPATQARTWGTGAPRCWPPRRRPRRCWRWAGSSWPRRSGG